MIMKEPEGKFEIKQYDMTQHLSKREQDEVTKIIKLRYSVYIEDLKYESPYADHKAKTLRDPLDDTGHLFGYFKNGEAIGTVLTNYAKNTDLGYYQELYRMHELANSSYFDSSICTKFMVRKDYRSSSIAFRLSCATLIQQAENNIIYSFIDCIEDNVPFFLRLGYKVCQEKMHHPDFGNGVALMMELQNIEELENCNSLYLKFYRKKVGTRNLENMAAQ